MSGDQIVKQVLRIRQDHPENLMARHFDAEAFSFLDAPSRQRLLRIFASGLQNPDSQMGAYAMFPDDYDLFAQFLDPMIRDYHAIPPQIAITQQHDWDGMRINGDLGSIDQRLKNVSMRVRVARNVSTFPLPGAMDKNQRLAFEQQAVQAFMQLIEMPAFGGAYLSLTPGSAHEIDEAQYLDRVKKHQMFKDMSADRFLNVAGISSDWPHGRGIYISQDEDFLVWVGEEDHLRIMAMGKGGEQGGDLGALFGRLHEGLEILSQFLPPFATSPTYGYVTSCPTNLGAGMRASLHLKLPNLASSGDNLSVLKQKARSLGLAVRGAGGEHSGAGAGGLVDISPIARLGVSEMEIMGRLFEGTAALWALENT
jgi:arginine kinase